MVSKTDLRISIECALDHIISETGSTVVVDSIFNRYGANGPWDLSPSYYTEAFGDLMQVEADLD